MSALFYDNDPEWEVELFDHVEVNLEGSTCSGQVKKLHPKSGEVTVRYDTMETYRTSQEPIWKTARFPISAVMLVRRDG